MRIITCNYSSFTFFFFPLQDQIVNWIGINSIHQVHPPFHMITKNDQLDLHSFHWESLMLYLRVIQMDFESHFISYKNKCRLQYVNLYSIQVRLWVEIFLLLVGCQVLIHQMSAVHTFSSDLDIKFSILLFTLSN